MINNTTIYQYSCIIMTQCKHRVVPTKTIKEVLSSDNVVTETEIGIIRVAAGSRRSRCVDTAGQIHRLMDNIVDTYLNIRVRIGPAPTGSRILLVGHGGLKRRFVEKKDKLNSAYHDTTAPGGFLRKKDNTTTLHSCGLLGSNFCLCDSSEGGRG